MGVKFRVAFNIEVNRVCPKKMVELSGLVELTVFELGNADCMGNTVIEYQNSPQILCVCENERNMVLKDMNGWCTMGRFTVPY